MENTSVKPKTINSIVVEELQAKVRELELELAKAQALTKWYEEQFRLGQRKRFGTSSEKTQNQLGLFDEAEVEAEALLAEPTVEEAAPPRRSKRKGKRKDDLSRLPVETIEYTLDADDQVCKCCGGTLHSMSRQVRQEIKVEPATVKVVEHVQMVYSCRTCERASDGSVPFVVTAPKPAPAIPNSIASPSTIAYIIDQKYNMSVPLNRQEQQWHSLGICISRKNMANWVIYTADRWFSHLYEALKMELLARPIVQADETTTQVLNERNRSAQAQSYMWLYRTGRKGPPITLFEYQPSRAGYNPANFLMGFSGYLQTDGYSGYNNVSNVIRVGCFAHARRKFDEALTAVGTVESRTKTMAQQGIQYCNQLFALERRWKDLGAEERYINRQEMAKPILDAFLAWLQTMQKTALPKSKFGQAITYCLNQWNSLSNYTLDGHLEITNNASERSIKNFIIGRKNWLFSASTSGARASAITYSIVQTAKENGLNVFRYIRHLLEQLPNIDLADAEAIERLFPWSDALPPETKLV